MRARHATPSLCLTTTPARRASQRVRGGLAASALLLACGALQAAGRCAEDDVPTLASVAPDLAVADDRPRQQLQTLVRAGLDRSLALGAARLLADAALQDMEEARAASSVQGGLTAGLGPAHSESGGTTRNATLQGQASVSISQLLWDGGRNKGLVDWRRLLAEAANQGELNQREQIALNTVVLALERNRYRMQLEVYAQFSAKMACLVSALQDTVAADRGRASELVQAQKSLDQVALQRAEAQSQLRLVELRLKRLVGEMPLQVAGLPYQLQPIPELTELLATAASAREIAQLGAQADAASRYADAVQAGNRPQLSWVLSGARTAAAGTGLPDSGSTALTIGLSLNVPLLSPGVLPATEAARRRAEAARVQRDDALDARRSRISELHEQSVASVDRAARVRGVLRGSEELRNATLQQWQQLGRRSLFDVIGAESEHYGLRLSYVNALHDTQQLNANLLALGRGIEPWLK
jgi:adhesin transport system outer membrane protein